MAEPEERRYSREEVRRLMARGTAAVLKAQKDAEDHYQRFSASSAQGVLDKTLEEADRA